MSNAQESFSTLDYFFAVSIAVNIVGLGLIIWKMKKIKDPKNNKTYSKISILMLYQLMLGLLMMILTLLAGINASKVENWLGKYNIYWEVTLNTII